MRQLHLLRDIDMPAAIDMDGLAGDVAPARTAQEARQTGNFLDRAVAAQRRLVEQELPR